MFLTLFLVSSPSVSPLRAAPAPAYTRLEAISSHLQAPTALAVDGGENIYVTESSRNRLTLFGPDGEYLRALGGLATPISVAVDGRGTIYVGNAGRKNVEIYDRQLLLRGKLGKGDGEFGQPSGIAVDGSGRIYVADSRANTVKVYGQDGSLLGAFGSSEEEGGGLLFPVSLSIDDAAGEITVTDLRSEYSAAEKYGGARVQVFDMEGGFLRSCQVENLLVKPLGVERDGEGRIYVSDAFQNVVQVFDGDGSHLTTLYDENNPLRTPLGLAYGKLSGRLFIASLSRGRIEVYALRSPVQTFSLTARVAGGGEGTVWSVPAGVDCGESCSAAFPIGAIVTLTAEASPGSLFAGWSGDCAGAAPCILTVEGDRNVTAVFSPLTGGGPAPSDFSGDGLSDVLLRDDATGALSMLILGGGSPAETHEVGEPGPQVAVEGTADFDNDGRADILLRHGITGDVFLWLMDGASVLAEIPVGRDMKRNWRVAGIGDFDGNGSVDVIWEHLRSGHFSMWLLEGTVPVAEARINRVSKRDWQVADVADLDGDGRTDILWRNAADGAVSFWLMDGAEVRDHRLLGRSSKPNWRVVAVDDFSGDGLPDILWRSSPDGSLYLWILKDVEVAAEVAAGALPGEGWIVAGSSDFNGDGLADLVAGEKWSGEVALWLAGNDGIFTPLVIGYVYGQTIIW